MFRCCRIITAQFDILWHTIQKDPVSTEAEVNREEAREAHPGAAQTVEVLMRVHVNIPSLQIIGMMKTLPVQRVVQVNKHVTGSMPVGDRNVHWVPDMKETGNVMVVWKETGISAGKGKISDPGEKMLPIGRILEGGISAAGKTDRNLMMVSDLVPDSRKKDVPVLKREVA